MDVNPTKSKPTSLRDATAESHTSVSVVVPTRNRPSSVVRAVGSALSQTVPPREVVVVVDGPDADTVKALEDLRDRRIRIVELPENGGPSRARNVGVATCSGEWVAFLDDDDEWASKKLQSQLEYATEAHEWARIVVATGIERRNNSTSDWWPRRSPSAHERISDYLFVRRQRGEGYLQTSTIMLRRDLALRCPFPEHLRIHEDYDWFIELEKSGARFVVDLEPLVIFNTPDGRDSLSSSVQWHDSLSWILSRRNDVSPQAFTDFCLTEVARAARATHSFRGEAAIFCTAATGKMTLFSAARFVSICLMSERMRRRIAAYVSRLA